MHGRLRFKRAAKASLINNSFNIQKTGHCQSFLLPIQKQNVKLMINSCESAYNKTLKESAQNKVLIIKPLKI